MLNFIFIKFSCVMCHIILLHKNILSNNNEIIVEESCYAPIGVIVIWISHIKFTLGSLWWIHHILKLSAPNSLSKQGFVNFVSQWTYTHCLWSLLISYMCISCPDMTSQRLRGWREKNVTNLQGEPKVSPLVQNKTLTR